MRRADIYFLVILLIIIGITWMIIQSDSCSLKKAEVHPNIENTDDLSATNSN